MTVLHRADPLGLEPWYYRVDRPAHGATIRQLLVDGQTRSAELDRQGVQQWLDGRPLGRRTCFAAVRQVPAGAVLRRVDERWEVSHPEPAPKPAAKATVRDVSEVISDSLLRILQRHPRAALALSGGLDSALLLALLRGLGADTPVFALVADLPGYHERDSISHTARWLSAADRLTLVAAGAEDFVEALPQAVQACETPMYNAHPVSKLLLARALRSAGIDAVITGDGADEVFAGADGRDYLPLVGALFRAAGVTLCTPFADAAVTRLARQLGADPRKSALRAAAEGVAPPQCLARPKRPTLAPPLDVDRWLAAEHIGQLAAELSLPDPPMHIDAERMSWITLSLLVRSIRSQLAVHVEEPAG